MQFCLTVAVGAVYKDTTNKAVIPYGGGCKRAGTATGNTIPTKDMCKFHAERDNE
jgi:hypothetical protein